jgi:hypothetical protein
MAWVRMTRDRIKTVTRQVSQVFKADCRYSVKAAWAEEFIAEGSAESLETPARGAAARPARRGRRKDTV